MRNLLIAALLKLLENPWRLPLLILGAALFVGVAGAQTHCQCNSDKPPVNSFSEVYTTAPPPIDCRKGFHLACYDDAPKVEPKPEAMDVKPVMVTEILAGWEELDGAPWWPSFDDKCPHGRWKHDKRGNGLFDCTHPVCKDKRRALITSEDGKLHCILFPTQEAK